MVNSTSHIYENSTANVTWSPFDTHQTTVSLIVSNATGVFVTIPAPNIEQYVLNATTHGFTPDSYIATINSSIGSGSTHFTVYNYLGLSVNLSPAKISSINGATVVSWSPVGNVSQASTTIFIYKQFNYQLVASTATGNTGVFNLGVNSFHLAPASYQTVVANDLGGGNVTLTVYSSTGLNITSPNNVSIIYNDSVAMPVLWTSFDSTTQNAVIELIEQSTMTVYNASVIDNGNATLNLVSLEVPAGTYNLSIASALGFGQTNMFVLRYSHSVTFSPPNITTNVSNADLLTVNGPPTNPTGANVTMFLYKPVHIRVVYGPFSNTDNGSATLDLSQAP